MTQITDLPQASTPLSASDIVLVIQGGVATQTSQANLVNLDVQSDWTEADTGDQSYIKHKPTLGSASALDAGTLANQVLLLNVNNQLPALDGSLLTGLTAAGVNTVASDGSIVVSAPAGDITIEIDTSHSNTWNAPQTFADSIQLGLTTPSTALVVDASANVISSSTTSTELDYVHGVTSAIQTQLDNKVNLQDSYTDGQILIGDTGTGELAAAVITNGYNIDITNGPNSIEIAVTPSGSNGEIQYNNGGVLGGKTLSLSDLADTAIDYTNHNVIVANPVPFADLTSGVGNTGFGPDTLTTVTSGSYNTAFGTSAVSLVTTGNGNTGVGFDAAALFDSGSHNTAIGFNAISNGTSGNNNTYIGSDATGGTLGTGSDNTLIGQGSDVSAENAVNRTVIGRGAIGVADNTVQIGNTSITDAYFGDGTVILHADGSALTGVVHSDTSPVSGSTQVRNFIICTQAEYNSITPDANTVYMISG